MTQYRRTTLPNEYSGDAIQREFEHIEQALGAPLPELHVEPTRPLPGMIVFADGTDWNPGSGQGIYAYYAGSWHKLG